MKINFNMSAIFANDNLYKSETLLSSSTEKLSSGYKINHAKDNPSGIAISKKMHAQIRGLSAATQSASNGISIIETAEGALTEVHDMLQRLNELAVKGSNGTMSDKDRVSLQEEADQMMDEINRISNVTEFNGSTLLDGSFDLKAYTEVSPKNVPATSGVSDKILTSAVKTEYYSDAAEIGYYELTFSTNVVTKYRVKKDEEGNTIIDKDGNAEVEPYDANVIVIEGNQKIALTTGDANGETNVHDKKADVIPVNNQKVTLAEDGHTVTITGDNNFSITLDIDVDSINAKRDASGNIITDANDKVEYEARNNLVVNLNLTGIGAMTMQIGANEGQVLDIRIPKISTKTLGLNDLSMETSDECKKSIDKISKAIDKLSTYRSGLGAYQNRLEHTVSSLNITSENMTSAYSRIIDVDMATEMTEYTKNQVLSQAGTSILAQANERPSQILQLLQ